MAHHNLDLLDKKILRLIAEDARIPFLEVARSCNVSGAAIHQRIQKLTNLGILLGSQFLIDPEKIGDVIGKQGKVIQKICAECNCKIDVQEDGNIFVSSTDIDDAKRAISIIETIANDPEVGAIYKGVVTRIRRNCSRQGGHGPHQPA